MNTIKIKLILYSKRACLGFFITLGGLAFLFVLLSFTDIPYYAYRRLSMEDLVLKSPPSVIVVLGGSGMPSPDGFIRCYFAAQHAITYPQAKIIIALPFNESDSLRQLKMMAHELVIRGVDSTRIYFEPLGFNTHSQAQNIFKQVSALSINPSVLLISSPEHMYRAVKTFQKVGFSQIGAIPAFDCPVDEEKIKDKENTKDTRIKNLSLRYNMWSYMNYEILVLREYCAISYYKIKGWI